MPALTPTQGGQVVDDELHRYADRAAATWIDAYLLSGSTTRGDLLTTEQRSCIIDLWLQHVQPERLIACCWNSADIAQAQARRVSPMAVMQRLPDQDAAIKFFESLPSDAYIYSHPMYTATTFKHALAAVASAANVLPAGGKIAKIGAEQITQLRAAAGQQFALWDGSSRHIARSVEAGASGVIATPLSHLPTPFPSAEVVQLQHAIDPVQVALDDLPNRPSRGAYLARAAFKP